MKKTKPFNIEAKVNIHNKFDIVVEEVLKDANGNYVLDANGDYVRTGARQDFEGFNTIVNNMWTRLCGGLSYFVNIHFGTGSGTPASTDTALFSYLSTKAAADVEQVKALPTSRWKRKIILNPEEFVGSTITEVAIAYGSGATNIVNHAMLKDSEGNQISIGPKTDSQVITIYATVYISFDISNENLMYVNLPSGNALINYLVGGTTLPSMNFRLLEIPTGATPLGSISTSPTWTADTANKKRKTNVQRFDINTGNGQVKALLLTKMFNLLLPIETIFNGQPYTEVLLGTGDGVTTDFEIPSNNVRVSSINVKIDGVTTNDYTVEMDSVYPIESSATITNLGVDVLLSKDTSGLYVSDYDSPRQRFYKRTSDVFNLLGASPFSDATALSGAAISRDGNFVSHALVSAQPIAGVTDLRSQTPVALPPLPNIFTGNCHQSAISGDGSIVAFSSKNNAPYLKIYRRDIDVWYEFDEPEGLTPVQYVALNDAGNVLAVCLGNIAPYIRVYDIIDNAIVERPAVPNVTNVIRAKLDFDGDTLAVGLGNVSPYAKVYDWVDDDWAAKGVVENIPSNKVETLDISDDGNTLVLGNPDTVNPCFSISEWTGTAWKAIPLPSTVLTNCKTITISGDGKTICTQSYGGSPYIYLYTNKYGTTKSKVKLNSPPASGAITCDYTVDGVHKTDQYVIDVSCAIAFGEGA